MTVPARNVYSPQRLQVVAGPAHPRHPARGGGRLAAHLPLHAVRRDGGAAPAGRALDGALARSTRGPWSCARACPSAPRPPEDPERPEVRAAQRGRPRPRPVRGRREGGRPSIPGRSPDAADEPVLVIFDKDRVKELRGTRTKKKYKTPDPGAGARSPTSSTSRARSGASCATTSCPTTSSRPCSPSRTAASSATPASTPSASSGAAVRNFKAESYVQGGSTITQQLVQELLPDPRAHGQAQGSRRPSSPSCSSAAPTRRTSSSST